MKTKAILILDMPKSCEECIGFDYEYLSCFGDIDGEFREQWNIKRQRWCPLKPLPKPKQIGDIEEIIWCDDTEVAYGCGWNACLKELEK